MINYWILLVMAHSYSFTKLGLIESEDEVKIECFSREN
jgi:hypothetical protein